MSRLPRVTPRQVTAVLTRAGFIEVKVKAVGGHRQFRRQEGGGRVTVPMHPGALEAGLLHSALRQAGLTPEEIAKLL